ncbi:hypothetical protein MLD38_021808 [Melastoma candidum]|uniref:Uncharacterized protein n=1 Tax=Melastoma candidum TaxID=119954 RepID=A0ACB9QHA8_9MYRT|nr:hypothetical protein MLD38_021808 [Melastoma candidum]
MPNPVDRRRPPVPDVPTIQFRVGTSSRMPPIASSPATNDTSSSTPSSNPNCHGFFYNALLIVLSVVFVGSWRTTPGRICAMGGPTSCYRITPSFGSLVCLISPGVHFSDKGWQCSPARRLLLVFVHNHCTAFSGDKPGGSSSPRALH